MIGPYGPSAGPWPGTVLPYTPTPEAGPCLKSCQPGPAQPIRPLISVIGRLMTSRLLGGARAFRLLPLPCGGDAIETTLPDQPEALTWTGDAMNRQDWLLALRTFLVAYLIF